MPRSTDPYGDLGWPLARSGPSLRPRPSTRAEVRGTICGCWRRPTTSPAHESTRFSRSWVSHVANKRPGTFSLGMGQRLGIAGALLGDPSVLLFDEPINGLDPEGIRWVRNLLKGLGKEGRTVFVSSHLMSEMALTADHLVVIGRGRLIAEMAVDEFIAQSSEQVVRVRTPQPESSAKPCARTGATVVQEDDGACPWPGSTLKRSATSRCPARRPPRTLPAACLPRRSIHGNDPRQRRLPRRGRLRRRLRPGQATTTRS